MTKALAVFIGWLNLVGPASACSLVPFSQEFRLDRRSVSRDRPPRPVEIASIRFVPWVSDGGSCDGMGWLLIELSTARIGLSRLKQQGYIVRPVAGVNDTGVFPEYPLGFSRQNDRRTTLAWIWSGITPDADGHVKWELELVPVARSGIRGRGTPFCVSSNGSCPGESKSGGDAEGG